MRNTRQSSFKAKGGRVKYFAVAKCAVCPAAGSKIIVFVKLRGVWDLRHLGTLGSLCLNKVFD